MNDETENTAETPVVEEETSLRDDIQSSLADLTAREEAPARETPEAEAVEPASGAEETEAARTERERDGKGRFSKKAAGPAGAVEPAAREKPTGDAPAPPVGAPVAVEPPKAAEPVEKAPQSWKPLAREHWAKIPAEVRQEVVRREQETNRVLQESAVARKAHQEFQEAIRPFEAMIRSEAGDPIRGIQGLLGTAYNLRTGAPRQKAEIVASLIQGYGVDIDTLAAALDGKPQPAQAQSAPQYDPRVDQLYQRIEAAERSRQNAATEAVRAQVTEASKLEFFEDLRHDMADIMELATRRGQRMSLDQAYQRAVAMSPDHQKIVSQREAAKSAASTSVQTQRARAAASSVRSSPAVAPPRSRGDTSLREDLEESLRELQGR